MVMNDDNFMKEEYNEYKYKCTDLAITVTMVMKW